jgi:hypothetical protein
MVWDCRQNRGRRRLQSRAKETEGLHEAECLCISGARIVNVEDEHVWPARISRLLGDETVDGEGS